MDKLPNVLKMKPSRSGRKKKSTVASEPALAYRQSSKTLSIHDILATESDRLAEPMSRVDTFRRGLQRKSLEKLKEVTGLDYHTLAEALAVSAKTLQRKQVFDVVQSEKMYELAELYALGASYFGAEGFRRWMERPLFSIGNLKPVSLIDVSEGMSLLKAEIMRMQHGIAV